MSNRCNSVDAFPKSAKPPPRKRLRSSDWAPPEDHTKRTETEMEWTRTSGISHPVAPASRGHRGRRGVGTGIGTCGRGARGRGSRGERGVPVAVAVADDTRETGAAVKRSIYFYENGNENEHEHEHENENENGNDYAITGSFHQPIPPPLATASAAIPNNNLFPTVPASFPADPDDGVVSCSNAPDQKRERLIARRRYDNRDAVAAWVDVVTTAGAGAPPELPIEGPRSTTIGWPLEVWDAGERPQAQRRLSISTFSTMSPLSPSSPLSSMTPMILSDIFGSSLPSLSSHRSYCYEEENLSPGRNSNEIDQAKIVYYEQKLADCQEKFEYYQAMIRRYRDRIAGRTKMEVELQLLQVRQQQWELEERAKHQMELQKIETETEKLRVELQELKTQRERLQQLDSRLSI